jgi:hypothetical protein
MGLSIMESKYWIGKEIEGRLHGLETVFLADMPHNLADLMERYSHILIGTSLINKMCDTDWDRFEFYINEGNFVTIEAKPLQLDMIPSKMKIKAHILLWIDLPSLYELKDTDSIKLTLREYEMYVFTLQNGQRVTKKDYIHDRY